MTILLLYRIEQVARYIDLGAAEDADVDDEAGAVVGTLKDIAFEAHELASVDAYLLATAQRARVDGYVALGIADHAHKAAHLLVGDDGNRAMAVSGLPAMLTMKRLMYGRNTISLRRMRSVHRMKTRVGKMMRSTSLRRPLRHVRISFCAAT